MLKFYFIAALVLAGTVKINCQNISTDVFQQGTLSEQLKYLNDRTRIYENYRAIREDMFQLMYRNVIDTMTKAKGRINKLVQQTEALGIQIDSLKKSMEDTHVNLTEATRTKNSINLLGMEVNKVTYNSVMWTMLGAVVFLLIIGYLTFKRNRVVTLRTRKDLEELKGEFEAYRQKTRIEREKTNLEHFNEIKKLKGGAPGRG